MSSTNIGYKIGQINTDLLCDLLIGNVRATNVPEDAFISAAQYNLYTDGFDLKIHSETYEGVSKFGVAENFFIKFELTETSDV